MADLTSPTGHVATYSALPTNAQAGDVYICDDNSEGFQWDGTTWQFIGSSGSGQAGSTPAEASTGQPLTASSTGSGPEYPALILGSSVSELLSQGFERSDDLPDGAALVQFVDPTNISVTWPSAENPEVVHSQISIRIEARALGGATIKAKDQEPKSVELEPAAAPNPTGPELLVKEGSRAEPEPQPV